jgi:hypothetical protein
MAMAGLRAPKIRRYLSLVLSSLVVAAVFAVKKLVSMRITSRIGNAKLRH